MSVSARPGARLSYCPPLPPLDEIFWPFLPPLAQGIPKVNHAHTHAHLLKHAHLLIANEQMSMMSILYL